MAFADHRDRCVHRLLQLSVPWRCRRTAASSLRRERRVDVDRERYWRTPVLPTRSTCASGPPRKHSMGSSAPVNPEVRLRLHRRRQAELPQLLRARTGPVRPGGMIGSTTRSGTARSPTPGSRTPTPTPSGPERARPRGSPGLPLDDPHVRRFHALAEEVARGVLLGIAPGLAASEIGQALPFESTAGVMSSHWRAARSRLLRILSGHSR